MNSRDRLAPSGSRSSKSAVCRRKRQINLTWPSTQRRASISAPGPLTAKRGRKIKIKMKSRTRSKSRSKRKIRILRAARHIFSHRAQCRRQRPLLLYYCS